MVLGRQIVTSRENGAVVHAHGVVDLFRSLAVVVSAESRRENKQKTRNIYVICGQPVCNEHLASETMCILCENE